jgi:hypothetical protein
MDVHNDGGNRQFVFMIKNKNEHGKLSEEELVDFEKTNNIVLQKNRNKKNGVKNPLYIRLY